MMKITGRLCAAASLLALSAGAALAQDTADVGEVVVTASRIQSAGFTAPTPTTVLGTPELTRRAPASIIEALNDIPSFRPSSTPTSTSSSIGAPNAQAGSAQVDLRGLGSSRTLLLVNGHRTGGSIDVNQFPRLLVQRVDVVTGGASAAYGSDAVGGVVNIILDTRFNGLRGDTQYAETKYGDDKTWNAQLAFGTSLFGDRAHLIVGGEYSDGKGARADDKRPWIADMRGVTIPNASRAFGLSPNINTVGFNFSTMNPGGLITAGPLKGITFDAGGVPRPFQYGTINGVPAVFGNNMIGGERADPSVLYLKGAIERYSLFSRLDVNLTSKVRGWVELSNSQVTGKANTFFVRDQGNLTVQAANPFIPAAIRAEMTRLGLATLTMGRVSTELGQPTSVNRNDVYRYAPGLEGELRGSWSWDAYVQYGLAKYHGETSNSRIEANWRQAIDVVAGPNGVPQCRNPANGCVPVNLFGPGSISPAAAAWVTGTQYIDTDRSQTAAAFNLHGEPFKTWAGPVPVAFGAEYRKEKIDTTADAMSYARAFNSGNTQPLKGSYDVKEAYAEVGVPLAKDLAFAKSFDVNGAVRLTDYSTSGRVTTWKVGATWEPRSDLLLRITRSRDIRAPSLNELYTAGASSLQTATNFRGPNAGVSFSVPVIASGNPDLKPERANTFTTGVTFRPRFARLRFSADYYSIKILDQIGSPALTSIDLCKIGEQAFCALINFDAAGTIVSIRNPFFNNNRFTVRGIDLELTYTQPMNEIWSALPGTLSGRAFATKTLEYSTETPLLKIDRSGQNVSAVSGSSMIPRWIANYQLTYDVGRFTGTVQLRYTSPGVIERTSITGTPTERLNNKMSSQTLTNLSAQYRVLARDGRRLELYGAINNVFNKGPPAPVYSIANYTLFYDAIGTSFRGGLRFSY
jgi:outer membrane receptor protein involved in Fe transport